MAEQQKKKWLEEKEEMETARLAKEEQRREMLLKRRQKEREELNHRLEEARNKFTMAQENLQTVLDKRDSKSEQLLEKFHKSFIAKIIKFTSFRVDQINVPIWSVCFRNWEDKV